MTSLAILGCGPSVWEYIEGVMRNRGRMHSCVWGINRIALALPCDKVIAMDDRRWIAAHPEFGKTAAALERLYVPVVTSVLYPEFTNSEAYPLQAVSEELEELGLDTAFVLNNSVNYALALALFEHSFESIDLYGCEYVKYPERGPAKEGDPDWRPLYYPENTPTLYEPGVEGFWTLVGVGLGAGVGVCVHDTHKWPRALYGYNEWPL